MSSIETPQWFVKDIRDKFEKFMWNSKPPRVRMEVLQNDVEHGGLRYTNLDHFISAQLTNWIKLLLTNENTVPYIRVSSFLP